MRRYSAVVVWLCALAGSLFADVTRATEPVLVEFHSRRCPPCDAMKPLIRQLASSGVAVRSVDVDREPGLADRYGVRQTPTFLVMVAGKEVSRLIGRQSAAELRDALATSTNGPWVDTHATLQEPPQTRLAPLNTAPPADEEPRDRSTTSRSEAMPSVAVADAIERAQAATVRLRVHDDQGHGVGTGTIIDTHGDEALVLTCGHLFRDSHGQGRIEVDLFVGGRSQTVAGKLIDYDADDRDIALVAIRPGFAVQPVPVVLQDNLPEAGSSVFSFGCDRGADPSRRDTRITGVNKYNQHRNASNLEIAGAPIDGRSGGGLFSSDGYLVGVCNAADFQGDIGIYAGPGAIHWQLDRVQLSRLYQHGGQTALVSAPAANASQPITGGGQPGQPPNQTEPTPDRLAGAVATGMTQQNEAADDSEVIVIIRDRNSPNTTSRVMTLEQPSPELLQMLISQSTHAGQRQ